MAGMPSERASDGFGSFAVQETCCFFPFAGNDVGYGLQGFGNGIVNLSAVFRTGFVQDIADDEVAVARVVDTEAQAVIVGRTEPCLNVFQPVVSAVSAAEFELNPAARNVEFVVDDEDFFGFDFIKLRKGGNCLSGTPSGRAARATSPKNFFSSLNDAFHFQASSSRNQKPALCRVCSYSLPGLPNPTTILILFDMSFSIRCRPDGVQTVWLAFLVKDAPAARFFRVCLKRTVYFDTVSVA